MSRWISNTFDEGLVKIDADKVVAMKQIIKQSKNEKEFKIVIWIDGIQLPLTFEYYSLEEFNAAWDSLEKLICKTDKDSKTIDNK